MIDLRGVSRSLWKLGLIVYLASLALRTVLMSAVYMPELERFSRPLAKVLQFVVTEMQALTSPVLAGALFLAAFICHPILSTKASTPVETDE